MMYQLVAEEVTNRDYPIQFQYISALSETTSEEVDRRGFTNNIARNLNVPFLRHHTSRPMFEIDLSSVWPRFEINTETFSSVEEMSEFSEEDIEMELLEHDFVVKMPPKKRYKVRVKLRSVKKGIPRLIDPDDFWDIE